MKTKFIRKDIIILFFTQIIACFFCFAVNNIKVGVFLSIIQFIISVFIIYLLYNKIFTFGFVLITISYILHMGNLFATQFLGNGNIYLYRLSSSTINKGILFFMLCHCFFIIGIGLGYKSGYSYIFNKWFHIDKSQLMQMGVICTIVGIGPRVYIDYQQIVAQINANYLESLNQLNQYGLVSILAQFFYVGILTLIFVSDTNKWRARIILCAVSLWEIITMLSGGRIYAISLIVAMIYIYVVRVEKPTKKQVIVAFISLYFLCSIINVVSSMRVGGAMSFEILSHAFVDSFGKDNPIISTLTELGSTFMSLGLSIDNFPSYNSYGYGKTYVSSVLSVLPLYEKYIADINDLIFIYGFRSHSALGGSWLGEAYYNFSWLGCVVCLFMGKFIAKFENIIRIDEKNNRYFGSAFIVTFVFYMILYMRDYFYRFTTTIQVFIVVLVISILPSVKIRSIMHAGKVRKF